MRRLLSFMLTGLMFGLLSTRVMAQQSTATEKKEPAMTVVAPTAPSNLGKSEITSVQNALHKAGFYKGKANGMLDKETETALRQYQEKHKLKVTGTPDQETLTQLGLAHSGKEAHHTSTSSSTATHKNAEKKPATSSKQNH